MAESKTLSDVISHSFEIAGKTYVTWQDGGIEELSAEEYKPFNRGYNVNRGLLAFVLDTKLYVLPASKESIDVLKKNEFRRRHLIYVPFANDDKPTIRLGEWYQILCGDC